MYAGSFDPFTNGHYEMIRRGLVLFDNVIVLVGTNIRKQTMFTPEERVKLIEENFGDDFWVETFDGLLANYMKENHYRFLLRGLRALSDFEYEFQMSLANRQLYFHMESVFLMANEADLYVSSSMVKEVALMGGDASKWVPPPVWEALKNKVQNYKEVVK